MLTLGDKNMHFGDFSAQTVGLEHKKMKQTRIEILRILHCIKNVRIAMQLFNNDGNV